MAVTWSPTYILGGAAFANLSGGDLTYYYNGQVQPWAIGSVGKSTGKWYWEYSTGNSTSNNYHVGVSPSDFRQTTTLYSNLAVIWRGDNSISQNGTIRYSAATVGVAPGNGVVGVAVDCDNGRVWFAKNNSWIMSGDPANGTNAVADAATHSWWVVSNLIFPAVNGYVSTTGVFASASLNYTPPSGFSALTDSTDWAGHIAYGNTVNNVIASTDFSGRYKISGTVTHQSTAGPYRVRLFIRNAAFCVGETWSDADGAYSFENIVYLNQGYFVVAYDHGESPLNAVIADFVTPVLM